MTPTLRLLSAFALVALLVGCGTELGFTQSHARVAGLVPRPAASVELLTAGPPQRRYTEFGLIEAHSGDAFFGDDRAEVLAKLRAYAGQIGCDAVVVAGDMASSTVYDGRTLTTVTRDGYRGTCIVYDAPPAPQAARAPAAEPTGAILR
jgi:hypothetical protein